MSGAIGDEDSLNPFKNRVVGTSIVVSVVAVALLFVVARFQPEPEVDNRLDPTSYAVLTQFLSTILSIGALALLWEWVLRRDHARSLNRYLALKSALVSSGLRSIRDPATFHPEIDNLIEGASIIRAVSRTPTEWVTRYSGAVLRAARAREIHVELIVPDPGSSAIDAMARSLGVSQTDLTRNINSAVESIKTSWSQAPHASDKSTISVVAVDVALYDILIVDRMALIDLYATVDHQPGKPGMALQFVSGEKVEWAMEQVKNLVPNTGPLWAHPPGQPDHFRN
ncbi:hypothetical protein [Nocardioides sp. Root190]|uniref:hypothetical protein n=1 Tax=Nocardioides sp. Root190 TaxID=1736488 RepID=UPI000A574664|nr:hypothetical protein [Nocardioides sp. Root190]